MQLLQHRVCGASGEGMGGANPRNNLTPVVKEDERSCSSDSMSQGSSICVPGGKIYEKGVGGGGEDEWLSLGSSFPGGGGAGMGETVLQVGREGDRKADSQGIWFFSKAGGLPAASAPHWSVRPFILWGYRDTMSWRECWESMATVHNEAGNVWTHVIGLAIFVSLMLHELARDDKELHHKVVATTYLFATNFCMASSAAFHLFTPHSKAVYERALRIDMTGIALVIIASFLVGLHYGYWCHPFLAQVCTVPLLSLCPPPSLSSSITLCRSLPPPPPPPSPLLSSLLLRVRT